MCKYIIKISMTIVFIQLISLSAANAYKKNVHIKITENAVIESQKIKPSLKAVGILQPGADLKNAGIL
jgi:hypothetical protein